MTVNAARQLLGRVGVVTGGSSGIGRATCLALAEDGASVVVVGRSPDRVRQTVNAVNRIAGSTNAIGLTLDVCREADMQRMAAETLEMFGRIDVLVASAGTLRGTAPLPRRLMEVSASTWDEITDTNLKGVFLSNRAVLPTMIRQRGGTIVNLSSTSGLTGLAFDSAYCASKFGVIGLSETVAAEVRQFGIRVHVLLSGPVATPMWQQNGPIPYFGAVIPPERIADAIRYVVSLAGDVQLGRAIVTPAASPALRRPAMG